MDYKIVGESGYPLVNIFLNESESIKFERGAMAYSINVNLEGKINSNKKGFGGFMSAIGRSLASGESMFITRAIGMEQRSEIGIAPTIPGKILCLQVNQTNQYRLNTDAFLACDETVEYVMKKQSVGKAFFGGTGGLFVMETQGTGDILISAFGDLLPLEVTPDTPIVIDNEHVVAWDASLNYDIQVASGTFGFKTGEGLVNKFKGQGKVLIQTRSIRNLAEAVNPFLTVSQSS